MRQKLFTILTLLALICSLSGSLWFTRSADAQSNTQNFTVTAFDADYYLDRDAAKVSTLHVIETITARFPSYDQNHGILRALPASYQNHTVNLTVNSVVHADGTPWKYTSSENNGNLVLKIGEANHYVHGDQTFKIDYTLRNVISTLADHQEFYWDTNGTQWLQPVDEVTARIHIPLVLQPMLQDRLACLTGTQGASEQNCTISKADQPTEVLITATAKNLSPGQNLTTVLGFTTSTFVDDSSSVTSGNGAGHTLTGRGLVMTLALFFGLNLLIIILTGWLTYREWKKIGRDAQGRGTIVPEYSPPVNLNALTSDFILQEQFRNLAISAQVIELAIRKYLAIYEVPTKGFFKSGVKYELELLQTPVDLTAEEQQVIVMFFGTSPAPGSRVSIADLANSLASSASRLGKSVAATVTAQGYFARNPASVIGTSRIIGGVMAGIGVVLCFTVIGLIIGPGLLISGLIVLLSAKTLAARTAAGVQAFEALKGLEMYMKMAEADRIRFLQSPEGAEKLQGTDPNDPAEKVKLFERLLPYAMLFGIEGEWAAQFKDLYQQPPDWYRGNITTFNALYLATALTGFSQSAVTAFAPPASSSTSGFGGGGFSGGGGGGGGGGGW